MSTAYENLKKHLELAILQLKEIKEWWPMEKLTPCKLAAVPHCKKKDRLVILSRFASFLQQVPGGQTSFVPRIVLFVVQPALDLGVCYISLLMIAYFLYIYGYVRGYALKSRKEHIYKVIYCNLITRGCD